MLHTSAQRRPRRLGGPRAVFSAHGTGGRDPRAVQGQGALRVGPEGDMRPLVRALVRALACSGPAPRT